MSDIVAQVTHQSDAEKAIRKDMIEGTQDGWIKFICEKIPIGLLRDRRIEFARLEALTMGASLPFKDLIQIFVSREDTAKMAYKSSVNNQDMSAWLLGKEHKAN